MNTEKDTWKLGNHEFTSRFILGSGKYSLELIQAAVENAGAQIVTMALRRANEGGLANILDYIPENVTILPNTSGARNAEEAVRIARLAREVCGSDFIKIEIMRDTRYLLPDNYETIFSSVEKLFKQCRKGVSFNFFTDKGQFQRPGTAYHDPVEILRFAYTLSTNVILDNSCFPYECTLTILKDNACSENGMIFDRFLRIHQHEFEDHTFVVKKK